MKRILLLSLSIFMAVYLVAAPAAKPKMVKIETTLGTIKVMLYDDTPLHRDNFLKLVNEGFYDGILFHRVIKDFMIQAGDPASINADSLAHLGAGDLGYTIPAEIVFPKYCHKRGALAAARLSDMVNPERQSSACQFYIVSGDVVNEDELDEIEQRLPYFLGTNKPVKYTDAQRVAYQTFGGTPHLDGQYTVFGEVVDGFDVIQKISEVETGSSDRPKKDVRIIKMKIVNR